MATTAMVASQKTSIHLEINNIITISTQTQWRTQTQYAFDYTYVQRTSLVRYNVKYNGLSKIIAELRVFVEFLFEKFVVRVFRLVFFFVHISLASSSSSSSFFCCCVSFLLVSLCASLKVSYYYWFAVRASIRMQYMWCMHYYSSIAHCTQLRHSLSPFL